MTYLTLVVAITLAFTTTVAVMPYLLDRLKKAGITGIDVNKPDKPKVPEMGGLAALIGFPSSMLVIMEVERVLNLDPNLLQISAVIGVLAIAALIGLLDDLVGLSQMKKAIYVFFASVPLLIIQNGEPVLETPFYIFDIPTWFYWFFLVPIGITGAANALNMSAGYNGLESGEFSIISFFLLIISYLKSPDSVATMIFSGLLGVSIALWIFNKYPSKMFVGNVGTIY